jgi:glycosyltransferase involved in cell wall biosynthesis
MKLSVIIPVYNEAAYLRRCLNSLRASLNNEGVEVIVIDDGSTDNSLEICQDFAKSLISVNNFRIIEYKYNYGVSFARNAGITSATGDFVTFLDADDEMAPDGITNMIKALYTFNLMDVIQFNHYRMENGTARIVPKYSARQGFYEFDNLPPKWAPVWNKAYNRTFLNSYGIRFPLGQQFDEDRQFNLACLKRTGGIRCVETTGIIKHFDNKESLCHTFDRKKATDALEALAGLLKEENQPEFDRLIIECLLMHLNSQRFRKVLGAEHDE